MESFSEGDDSEHEEEEEGVAGIPPSGNQAQVCHDTVKQSNKMNHHKKQRASATLQVVSCAFLIIDT